jgi:hypothetical protein
MQRGQELVEDNGGTVLALAGEDYCVLAADTRLSSDYRIRTRNVTRLFEVSHRKRKRKRGRRRRRRRRGVRGFLDCNDLCVWIWEERRGLHSAH